MATTKNDGYNSIDDVVVYEVYGNNVLYGYKLIKYIWIEEISEYRWIAEHVKIKDNKVTKVGGGSLALVDSKTAKNAYPLKWTKDNEYKKGDILFGKDGDKTMIFVYIDDRHVERLTPRSDMWTTSEQGYSTLSDFETNFGPLKIAEMAHPSSGKFSAM